MVLWFPANCTVCFKPRPPCCLSAQEMRIRPKRVSVTTQARLLKRLPLATRLWPPWTAYIPYLLPEMLPELFQTTLDRKELRSLSRNESMALSLALRLIDSGLGLSGLPQERFDVTEDGSLSPRSVGNRASTECNPPFCIRKSLFAPGPMLSDSTARRVVGSAPLHLSEADRPVM